ncbi:MAG: alpha/beta hydrolase, partial [Cyanobacteria bacterium]|nr:alpha/beta hydrolase [Cyanobacteriota bacterium]
GLAVLPQALEPDQPGVLLVALHGWMLSGRLWEPLNVELQQRWRLWCPDLPGFGVEPRPVGLQPSLASYGRWVS